MGIRGVTFCDQGMESTFHRRVRPHFRMAGQRGKQVWTNLAVFLQIPKATLRLRSRLPPTDFVTANWTVVEPALDPDLYSLCSLLRDMGRQPDRQPGRPSQAAAQPALQDRRARARLASRPREQKPAQGMLTRRSGGAAGLLDLGTSELKHALKRRGPGQPSPPRRERAGEPARLLPDGEPRRAPAQRERSKREPPRPSICPWHRHWT